MRHLSFIRTKPRLATKMVIALSLIILVSSTITGYLSYSAHLDIAEKEISKQFAQKVEQVSSRIDAKINEVYRFSDTIIFHPTVTDVLSKSNEFKLIEYENLMNFNDILNNLKLNLDYVYSIEMTDRFRKRYKPTHSTEFQELNQSTYDKIAEALSKTDGEMVWQRETYHTMSREYDVIVAARKIKNEKMDVIGQLLLVFDSRQFVDVFDDVLANEDDIVNLYTPRGNLLYSNQDKSFLTSTDRSEKGNNVRTEMYDGERYLLATNDSGISNFRFESAMSLQGLHNKSQTIFHVSLLSGLVSLAIAILLIAFASYRLLGPLKTVVSGMKSIKEGKLDTRIKVKSNDELAYLGNSFNEMIDFIQSLIKNVYQTQLDQREAELTALQAQLNPHFLYNTLDMLRSKLYLQDDFENADLVVALSQMLRYAIEPASTTTTIKDELHQINNYLTIQKSRFEEELHINMDVDDEVYDCSIVRLLLQPIVENVFVHGFRDQVDENKIHIKAYKQQSFLMIEVQDNGCGMNQAAIEQIYQRRSRGEKTNGIGMANVIRRIALMYDDPHRLEIESEEGKGTLVRLILPIEMEWNDRGERDAS
ncbi:sensor histidine kinase [Aquibacillus koreensis]|uniref:histidine kinase n=1 Tax=Aquibacillus koreensis TaxID=279446 RepID=A0A9X3WQW7_9BACI|nr:sensor histidine kinase [Aquibacillus koreensis]MCT2536678.1 sensor histidine kinase [Aquibacillus koreensis]MDC3422631.1 sensor histidine kinase [Aquibacillus koreensis]